MTPTPQTTITSTPSNWTSFTTTCSTSLYALAATVALVTAPCIGGVSDCFMALGSYWMTVVVTLVVVGGCVACVAILVGACLGKSPSESLK